VVSRVVEVDRGGGDGRMSKDLADAKEGDVALDGEGGTKKAKLCLAFSFVDRGGIEPPTHGFSELGS
jgi:hypothetical protein